MARSFAPNDLIALPRLTAITTARLLFELVKVASEEKKLPSVIVVDRDSLSLAHDALGGARKSRLRNDVAQATILRTESHAEENAFVAIVDWLRAFARLPPDKHPEAALAQSVLDAVFPGTLGFLGVSPVDAWQEADTRLAIIIDEHHDVTIQKLGGDAFLAELTRAHRAYGEALGITKSKLAPRVPSLRETLDNAHEVLRAYALRISAYVRKRAPETSSLADRLLAPLAEWRDLPSKVEEAPATKRAEMVVQAGA
jgi:hypothetical protein